jgi:predicted RNA-binding Zn-ribbon protein involved in translation (DUF1610 family)
MFNSIALRLKCPHCGTSLMDPEHPLDAQPSVRLNITLAGNWGTLWLSSIYGDYSVESDIPLPEGEIATLTCPHCGKSLSAHESCEECYAPMVSLHLQKGGRVSFCARRGCTKHSVEFDDINVALDHFYHDFAYSGRTVLFGDESERPADLRPTEERKELLESGTYLQSYCPHCRNTLIDGGKVRLTIQSRNGEEGLLELSPYLNVFDHHASIQLPDDDSVADILCPKCGHSLMVEDRNCPKCDGKLAMIQVAATSKMVDFHICTKKGCPWHGLSDSDLQQIMLEDSPEW